MIDYLIWLFTDRLERVIWINITNGMPTEEEMSNMHKHFESRFKCKSLITFDRSYNGTSIKSFYIKKK